MALAPISRINNGLVEIGLILTSVILGLTGQSVWLVVAMVCVSLVWWAYVHHVRLASMFKEKPAGAMSSLALAIIVMAIGHGLGFILGGAFHSILGFK